MVIEINTKKYVIVKQFRDPTGLRMPGETIELSPVRAEALRASGLIGGEAIKQERLMQADKQIKKDNEKKPANESKNESINETKPVQSTKSDEKKPADKKSNKSAKTQRKAGK